MKKNLIIAVFMFTAMNFINVNAANLEKSTSTIRMAEGGLTCLEAVWEMDQACGGLEYEMFDTLMRLCEERSQE